MKVSYILIVAGLLGLAQGSAGFAKDCFAYQ